jgi:hypothetical protein
MSEASRGQRRLLPILPGHEPAEASPAAIVEKGSDILEDTVQRISPHSPIWSAGLWTIMLILSDEIIIFATLDAIAIIWMFLRILVNHWIDVPPPPKIQAVKWAA